VNAIAPNGSEVAITAAHLIESADGPITVTDSNDRKTTVTGGCYVYQYRGKRVPIAQAATGNEQYGAVDYAILDLRSHIGSGTLQLSNVAPERDQWVTYLKHSGCSRTLRMEYR
jgi:hypothetical protein